jgi:hypothetical protein
MIFFSVPFGLFSKSAYACRDPSCSDATTRLIKVRDAFGVDPVWLGSRSELPFLSSLNALFRFQSLATKFTMWNSYSPSH